MSTDIASVLPDSDHHQPVENKVNEDTETIKQEEIHAPKDDVGEKESEKPKAENPSSVEVPVTISKEMPSDEKKTKPPVVVEAEKIDVAPLSDVPSESNQVSSVVETVESQPEEKLKNESAETVVDEKPAPETVENVPAEKPSDEAVQVPEETTATEKDDKAAVAVEDKQVEGETKEEAVGEPVEKEPENKPETETVDPFSLTEELKETSPAKDAELEIVMTAKEVSKTQVSEASEDKPQEQSQDVTEEAEEKVAAKTEEIVKKEELEDEGAKEENVSSVVEHATIESLVSINKETPAELSLEAGKDSFLSDAENAVAEETSVKVADEGPLKEETIVASPVEEEKNEKEIEADKEALENDAKIEQVTESETTKIVGVTNGSPIVAEVAEKSFVEEQGSRDLDGNVKEKEESVKDDTATLLESNGDKVEEVKVNEAIDTSPTNESIEGPKDAHPNVKTEEAVEAGAHEVKGTEEPKDIPPIVKTEENVKADGDQLVGAEEPNDTSLDVKTEETVKPEADRLYGTGQQKDVHSNVKTEETVKAEAKELEGTKEPVDEKKLDPTTLESPKDVDTQTTRDLPVQEVPPKQKSSGNIISKVKQSIVKVKKAIIGKSPSSKTLQPETKAEEKIK